MFGGRSQGRSISLPESMKDSFSYLSLSKPMCLILILRYVEKHIYKCIAIFNILNFIAKTG